MRRRFAVASGFLAFLSLAPYGAAQNASLTGVVKDPQGAVVPDAIVSLIDLGKQTSVRTLTNQVGVYEFPILQPGQYSLRTEVPGFEVSTISPIPLEVDQRGRADVTLSVSGAITTVEVSFAGVSAVETESSSVGDVIGSKTITDIPLNGRFFLDMAVLTPGSVLSSTNGRSSSTSEAAFGAFSINSSGARSDSASFMIDGINLNDGTQITFQPSIESVQEFKAQSSSFNAEYGRTSGIIVNGVTKSGTNSLHGTLFEFLRNEKLDALNFFDPPRSIEEQRTGEPIAPFKRNIFGESVGGPVLLPKLYNGRNRTFFFENYEGRRLYETETFTATVPTLSQRATVTNPVVEQMLTLLPLPNNSGVTVNNFTGQAPRFFVLDNTTIRVDHLIDPNNTLFVSTIIQPDHRLEASDTGTHNIPGFGDFRVGRRNFLSIGYTHIFSATLTGELRAGGNRVTLDIYPQTSYLNGLTPAAFGLSEPGSIDPDIRISGGPTFGGISGEPQGRADTTYQGSYTLSWFKGRNAIKGGAEYRVFYNNGYNDGTGGQINFSSLTNFLAGIPSTTSLRIGNTTPAISMRTISGFVQDDYKALPNLTLNIGLRYEFNTVPTERHDHFSLFNFATDQLVASSGAQPYRPDYLDFSPRLGLSWDPFGKGRTAIRAGAGVYFDDPIVSVIAAEASNPPFATAYTYTYSGISLLNPFAPGATSALSPTILTPDYKAPRAVHWNLNIQQQAWNTIFQIGYIGSSGNRLAIQRDFNQGIDGVRPLPQYGPITLEQSTARSSYNAMWLSANRKLVRGLTLDASYTFSKSIDTDSTSGSPQVQNSYNINAEKGLSDFDARHRLVASVLYQLPWKARRLGILANDWAISLVGNYQSGNPFNPIVSSLRSGSLDANDRPDVVYGQSINVPNPNPSEWFNVAAFTLNAINSFGDAGRNVLTGPPLHDADVSLLKNFPVRERVTLQFRASCYNVGNTPNFGQPGNTVGASTFGVISSTRSQAGDFGSSREIEFALKLIF
jgi:Carboxypeptidase regulatory-like domain